MESPDQSFAGKFNVLQEYAILDVRRAAVSLPFQIHRLWMPVEAGLVTFSSACFKFADEVSEEAKYGSLGNIPKNVSSHLCSLSNVAVVEFCT